MISINNLFKRYKIGKEHVEILNDINLEIEQGEFVAILGASGCGKSTLLNIIGGLDNKIDGNIYIDKISTEQYKEKDWNHWRKQGVGFVFQNFNLIPNLTAKENVKLAMKFNGYSDEEADERALELIEMVGLLDRSDYFPSQLSGGQKQRIAIARAMANDPKVILADEPTGSLDTVSEKSVMEILYSLNRNKAITIIMVTHNKRLAEGTDKVIHMKDGQIEKIIHNNTPLNKGKQFNHIANNAVSSNRDGQKSKKRKSTKLSKVSAMKIGIKNIISQKRRSVLCVSGIAIGIAGVMIMMGIGSGAGNIVDQELSYYLDDYTIWVQGDGEVKIFESEDIEALESIEGVDRVLPNDIYHTTLSYQETTVQNVLEGFTPIESMTEYELSLVDYGRLPNTDNSKEIVLGSDVAKKLLDGSDHVNELIGKKIDTLSTLQLQSTLTHEVRETFTVVGIHNTGIIGNCSYIPYETSTLLANLSLKADKTIQESVKIITTDDADYKKVVEGIRDLGYEALTNEEDYAAISIMVMGFKIFLILIAGVGVFVSAIMIKIVLQTNVIERTREIGIMRAIGAGRKDVKRIFITEAAILGVVAAIFGVGLGEMMGYVLNKIFANKIGTNFSLYGRNIQNVVICFSISIIIAVLSGRKPAKKAAKLDPTIALRYE